MPYAIKLLKRAERDLSQLPKKDLNRVSEEIAALADNPRPPRAKQLQGDLKGHFRIRVGNYRVVYQVDNKASLVAVVRIGHRREVYRRR
jgi:mRNA interferase RelE/StbE